ncbi:MAG: class I SAM-dependent methyltransferase [Thermoplasmatota archaeon]
MISFSNSNTFFYYFQLLETVKVRCFSVKPLKAEKVRRVLIENGVLLHEFPVITEKDQVIFPVQGTAEISLLEGTGAKVQVIEREMIPRKVRPRSYKELLELDEDLMSLLPSSFDMIGDIAIMKLPTELIPRRLEIGNALGQFNRNIRSVALNRGVKGDLRVMDLEVISGDSNLETTHVENNLRFKLDPSLVYFSPRLATERMRVAEMVRDEKVLDMFAGIGPFSINIASLGRAETVVGIDLNPHCIRYFNTNILLNSVEDRVETHLGDARDISSVLGPFDRVVMNLPHNSIDFLDVALSSMDSGYIHLYRVLEHSMIMDDVGKIMSISEKLNRKMEVALMREVHNYSPTQSMFVFDIRVLS